jgi:hypothetical protein
VIEPFGKYPECECPDARDSLIPHCAVAEHAGKIRSLGVIEPFGKNSECERLDARNSLVPGCAVAEHTGKVRDLGNPATVVFEFELDSKTEAHRRTVTQPASCCLTSTWSRRRLARWPRGRKTFGQK